MKRNNTTRAIVILLVLAWAIFEMQPPTDRPLVEVFDQQASNKDAAYAPIIAAAKASFSPTNAPSVQYRSLREAVGTNDLTKFFNFSTKGE
jgi:hypothetical protein